MPEDLIVAFAARNYREGIVRARFLAELLFLVPIESLVEHQEHAGPRIQLAAKSISLESLIELQRDTRLCRVLLDARKQLEQVLEIAPAAPAGKV